MAGKDHDTNCGMMVRLWLAHSTSYCMYDMYDLYVMYGMWYFGELTKLCAYSLWFMVSGTSDSKGNGPA